MTVVTLYELSYVVVTQNPHHASHGASNFPGKVNRYCERSIWSNIVMDDSKISRAPMQTSISATLTMKKSSAVPGKRIVRRTHSPKNTVRPQLLCDRLISCH